MWIDSNLQLNARMPALVYLLFVCVIAHLGQAQLSCDSFLRPYYPEYFTHCCVYSEWSDWFYIGGRANDRDCPTGESYNETRSRHLIGFSSGCEQPQIETEIRRKCVSDGERLIEMLGLGQAGTQNLDDIPRTEYGSDEGSDVSNDSNGTFRRCPSITGEHGYICPNLYNSIDRRSVRREKSFEESSHNAGIKQNQKVVQDHSSTLPVIQKDHTLFRRQGNRQCKFNDVQYILFLLDTSGSIGTHYFSQFTQLLGDIAALFCNKVQVAMMTFNHQFHLEFCFNCYPNNLAGRKNLSEAIKNIQYREGQTYTAAAARCACIDLLQESCGLPQNTECLDVVLITDGQSNDPSLELCEEVGCLHNRALNTYAVGVGDFNNDEIECIQNATEFSAFKLDNHDQLLRTFEDARYMLNNHINVQYSCLNNAALADIQEK